MATNNLKCGMCSKAAKRLIKRWYKYDSGEQFLTLVCESCSDLHDSLIEKAI